jgi:hypothetical protein
MYTKGKLNLVQIHCDFYFLRKWDEKDVVIKYMKDELDSITSLAILMQYCLT